MQKQYYAFISYSRKNSKAANFLHRQLQHFRIPVKYVSRVYSALNDRAKALEFLRRAVYIAEKALGAEHQTTLQFKNELQTLENNCQN